jgi:hypothetical protein
VRANPLGKLGNRREALGNAWITSRVRCELHAHELVYKTSYDTVIYWLYPSTGG